MAAGRLDAGRRAWKPMVAFAAFALLPDADVIGFALKIPYAAPWGHRGASHSLGFAALLSLLSLLLVSRKTAAILFATLTSHGLLDALTDGGLGIALLWPFSNERFFAPWTPIPVAPIGAGMLSGRGLYVVGFELAAFAPFWLWALRPSAICAERRREP